ncbi:uncharacterized protein [Nicotiana sylvestris]|uniref:uncharacterized protein n=1 Tax=Nicotiana sylvestris TaxID=4096 RepID=UPI00388C8089
MVMMIHSSETSSKEKVTSGKSVVQLKGVDNKPAGVAGKGSSSAFTVKLEKAKVVVPGVTITQLPMINSKAVPWNYERVIVTYQGKEVKEEVCETHGLTRSGRCFAPEELRKAKTSKDNPVLVKKAVTEEEAEEFLRKMKAQGYSIVEQLRKTPAQISLLSLLIHSYEHRHALMKILNEAHIPDKISVNHLQKIANKIFEVNRVTFSDDEVPVEGTEHNRALYLTVKCEDSVVTRVLVDNGSSVNICPLSILNKVQVEDERIHKNSICVRGFDGGGKDSVGDIVLELTIGPIEFTMEFQVFDTVSVEKIPKGKCVPTSKMAAASVMVAVEMLKNGFVPGKGLGASLQDVRRARKMKQKAWAFPKPIPHLSRSFVRLGIGKQLLSKVPGPLIGADGDLEKGFERLFAEVNMVQAGEGSNRADVQFVGPRAKLNNWETTPLPIRRESCSFYADINDMTCLRNLRPSFKSQSISKIIMQKIECDDELEFEDDEVYEDISKELSHFEEKAKPNLNDTEAEIEMYVDDVIVKSRKQSDHVRDLKKFFRRLRRYNLKINPAKCAFGVPSGKLLGFVVSRWGIELDPSKIKAIQELPPPKNKTERQKSLFVSEELSVEKGSHQTGLIFNFQDPSGKWDLV